jgi:hypothetical protein
MKEEKVLVFFDVLFSAGWAGRAVGRSVVILTRSVGRVFVEEFIPGVIVWAAASIYFAVRGLFCNRIVYWHKYL